MRSGVMLYTKELPTKSRTKKEVAETVAVDEDEVALAPLVLEREMTAMPVKVPTKKTITEKIEK